MDNERTGRLLRRVRERKGWSADDLAEKMGVGKSEISRLENGKRAHLDFPKLERWCEALGVRVELVMFTGTEDAAGLTELLADVAPEDAALARELLATLPAMGDETRSGLRGMLLAIRQAANRP